MQKKKLTLSSLKVKSFLTTFEQDTTQTLKGGDIETEALGCEPSGGGAITRPVTICDLTCHDTGGSHTDCGTPGPGGSGQTCPPPPPPPPPGGTGIECPTGFGCFQTDFC